MKGCSAPIAIRLLSLFGGVIGCSVASVEVKMAADSSGGVGAFGGASNAFGGASNALGGASNALGGASSPSFGGALTTGGATDADGHTGGLTSTKNTSATSASGGLNSEPSTGGATGNISASSGGAYSSMVTSTTSIGTEIGGALPFGGNAGTGGAVTTGGASRASTSATGGSSAYCGNGDCDLGETNDTCCQDCGCPTANALCQQSIGSCVTPMSISAGGFHTCAVMQNGTISCWGGNGFGELGIDTGGEDVRHPSPVPGLASAKAVAAGGTFTCAIVVAGSTTTVLCWGDNSYGQLGNGSTTSSSHPVQVLGLANVTALAAGYDFACARTSDGGVWCWGNNAAGQLGTDKVLLSLQPVAVPGIVNASNGITTGYDVACVLISDGTVRCWGDNYHGQFGNGTTSSSFTPQSVLNLPNEVRSIAAGCDFAPGEARYSHVEGTVCAVLSDGSGRCWGSYDSGALGVSSAELFHDSTTPVAITNLVNASSITAGYYFSCAITNSNDNVRCWGYGGDGELGNGTATTSWTPLDVNGLTGVNAIAAGTFHVCALLNINAIRCWGSNGHGQLGTDTTTTKYLQPVDVKW